MQRWSKHDSMILMKFLIDGAKSFYEKSKQYYVRTFVHHEFPRHLIPDRTDDELKDKAEYLLNEEIHHFATFPLKARIRCLHVFNVHLTHEMVNEVINSDSFDFFQVGKSLSLTLDGNNWITLPKRADTGTAPNVNLETMWLDESDVEADEVEEVPRNEHVARDNSEEPLSRAGSPQEEDPDDSSEHEEQEALDHPAQFEGDDEPTPSTSPNGSIIDNAADRWEPEATINTSREELDSDEVENSTAPQNGVKEADERIDVQGDARDNHHFDEYPVQDEMEPEDPPSRAALPRDEDQDDSTEHAERDAFEFGVTAFEGEDEAIPSTLPNGSIIDDAADRWESEATTSTSKKEADSDELENSTAPQKGINKADERFDVQGVARDNHHFDEYPVQDVMDPEDSPSRAASPRDEARDDSVDYAERDAFESEASASEDEDEHVPLKSPNAAVIDGSSKQSEPSTSRASEVEDSNELENSVAQQNTGYVVLEDDYGEMEPYSSHHALPTEDSVQNKVTAPILSEEAEQDVEVDEVNQNEPPSSGAFHGFSLQCRKSRTNNASQYNNQPSTSGSTLRMSSTCLNPVKTVNARNKGSTHIPNYVPERTQKWTNFEALINFAEKEDGNAEELAEKWIEQKKVPAEDRNFLIEIFRNVYQESFNNDSMNRQPTMLYVPPNTSSFQGPSTSARLVTFQGQNLAKASNRVRRRENYEKIRVLSETTKIAEFIISEYRNSEEGFDLEHLAKRYVEQSATSATSERTKEIYDQMLYYFPSEFLRNMNDEAKILMRMGRPMGSLRYYLHRSSIFQLDRNNRLTFYLSIGRKLGKRDRTKAVDMKMTEYIVLVFLKELSRKYKDRWTDVKIMDEFMKWRGRKTKQDVLDFMSCLRMAEAEIPYRKDLITQDKLKMLALTGTPIPPDFAKWCSRNSYLDQEAIETTSGHSPLGPQQLEDFQQEEPLDTTFTDVATVDLVPKTLTQVLSETSKIADIIIYKYREKSTKFDLEKLAIAYTAQISRPYKFEELHDQLSNYFSKDFFEKMRDEAFVLKNKQKPMNYFPELLCRSSIFQLDKMNFLTFYASIGQRFGEMNERMPVEMKVSEYVVTVFLMELTRRTREAWSDRQILAEFQKWRRTPGSQNDERDFMFYLQNIKTTFKHRRDLTTRDKQDLLQLFGAQIPSDSNEWCNYNFSLNQNDTGNIEGVQEYRWSQFSNVTRIADFILEEYQKANVPFDLETLSETYRIRNSSNESLDEIIEQLCLYFPGEFFDGMNAEAKVLNGLHQFLYDHPHMLENTLIHQWGPGLVLVHYVSMQRTIGDWDPALPFYFNLTEFGVLVFLKDLAYRVEKPFTDEEIVMEFANWKNGASADEIEIFSVLLPTVKNCIESRRDLTTFDKVQMLFLTQTPVTMEFHQWVTENYGVLEVDHHRRITSENFPKGVVMEPDRLDLEPEQRDSALSEFQHLENSSSEAHPMDAHSKIVEVEEEARGSPMKEQHENLVETEGEPELEHYDEVIDPVIQQEEPVNNVSPDVPREDLALQNLPVVEIIEEEEAPPQQLVEDVEEDLRNNDPPPNIDEESVIAYPRLMEYAIENKESPEDLATKFIQKRNRPESDRSYLIEQFRKIYAKSKEFNRKRSSTRYRVQMNPAVSEDLPKNLEYVRENRRNQFNNITKMADYILNEYRKGNVSFDLEKLSETYRRMSSSSHSTGEIHEQLRQYFPREFFDEMSDEAEVLGTSCPLYQYSHSLSSMIHQRASSVLIYYLSTQREIGVKNPALPVNLKWTEYCVLVFLRDLAHRVKQPCSDTKIVEKFAEWKNLINADEKDRFSVLLQAVKQRIESRRDLTTFDKIHMLFLTQTPVSMEFRHWVTENYGLLEVDDQGCITQDPFPRWIGMESEQGATSHQTPPISSSEQHEMTNGSEQVMIVGRIPSPSEAGNDKDSNDDFEENQEIENHHEDLDVTMEHYNGDRHPDVHVSPMDDPSEVPTASAHSLISPVQNLPIEFENDSRSVETTSAPGSPKPQSKSKVSERSERKKKKQSQKSGQVDCSSISENVHPTDASFLIKSSKNPELSAQNAPPSTVQQLAEAELVPSTSSETPTSSSHHSTPPATVQHETMELENGGPSTETSPPPAAPIGIPIQMEKDFESTPAANHRSNGVVVENSGSKTDGPMINVVSEASKKKKRRSRKNIQLDRSLTTVTVQPTDTSTSIECSTRSSISPAQSHVPSSLELPQSSSHCSTPPLSVQDELETAGPSTEPSPPPAVPLVVEKDLKCGNHTEPKESDRSQPAGENGNSSKFGSKTYLKTSEEPKKKNRSRKSLQVDCSSTLVTLHPTDTSTSIKCSFKNQEPSVQNNPPSTLQQSTKEDPIPSTSSEIQIESSHRFTSPVSVHFVTAEVSNEDPSTGSSPPAAAPIEIQIQMEEELEETQPAYHESDGVAVDDRFSETNELENKSKVSEEPRKKKKNRKDVQVGCLSTAVTVQPTDTTSTSIECSSGSVESSTQTVIPAAAVQSTSSATPASSAKDPHLPTVQSASLKDWSVRKLRELALFLATEKRVKWEKIFKKSRKQLDEAQLAKLLSEVQDALSNNFEKFEAMSTLSKLKLLFKLRVPIREGIKDEISKDTVYQLDEKDCLTYFCYQAVRGGKRDEKVPDNLSQLHRKLLDAMVSLSQQKAHSQQFLSDSLILNSLETDKRHGLTDKELLEEIKKAKNYISSDDQINLGHCLGVLKATRTAVTKLFLSRAIHHFEVKTDESNTITSYWKNGSQTGKSLGGTAEPVVQQSAAKRKLDEAISSEAKKPEHVESSKEESNSVATVEESGSFKKLKLVPSELDGSANEVVQEQIPIDNVPATPTDKQSMSAKATSSSNRTQSSKGTVVQQSIVETKDDDTKEKEPDSSKKHRTTSSDAKEPEHSKHSNEESNSTEVATIPKCPATNLPIPESNGAICGIVQDQPEHGELVASSTVDPSSLEEQESSSGKMTTSSSEAIPLYHAVQDHEFWSISDKNGELAPTGTEPIPSRKRQASDVEVSDVKRAKTGENQSCQSDQGEASTPSAITPDAETSNSVPDMPVAMESSPVKEDAPSSSEVSQEMSPHERVDVEEQVESKIETDGQVSPAGPLAQTSNSVNDAAGFPKAAPPEAIPAVIDDIEPSKTSSNQVQLDEELIESSQIRQSILTGLEELKKDYPMFGEEYQRFKNADVDKIEIREFIQEFDTSLESINVYIREKQSVEEKELEGVPVIEVLHTCQTMFQDLRKYEEDYKELSQISDKISVIKKQMKRDETGYNVMPTDAIKYLLRAIISPFFSIEEYRAQLKI